MVSLENGIPRGAWTAKIPFQAGTQEMLEYFRLSMF
jgi:hypothetical protein